MLKPPIQTQTQRQPQPLLLHRFLAKQERHQSAIGIQTTNYRHCQYKLLKLTTMLWIQHPLTANTKASVRRGVRRCSLILFWFSTICKIRNQQSIIYHQAFALAHRSHLLKFLFFFFRIFGKVFTLIFVYDLFLVPHPCCIPMCLRDKL